MDNSPTALFNSYELDFQQLIDGVKKGLDGDAKDERAGKLLILLSYCSHWSLIIYFVT